jgi:hypothetical protein
MNFGQLQLVSNETDLDSQSTPRTINPCILLHVPINNVKRSTKVQSISQVVCSLTETFVNSDAFVEELVQQLP